MPRLTLLRTAALGTSLLLAGCGWLAPPPIVRGNHPEADQLKELVPGTSTKQDVTSLLSKILRIDVVDVKKGKTQ